MSAEITHTEREEAIVVELFPGLDEIERVGEDAPLQTRRPENWSCSHYRTRLDTASRRVYCRNCEEEVPPFDVLRNLAQSTEGYLSTWRRASEGAERARKQLEGLERREKNTKSRIRRAKKHAGPTTLEIASHIADAMWRATMPVRDPDAEIEKLLKWIRDRVEDAEDDF